jgi:hypothetical protein
MSHRRLLPRFISILYSKNNLPLLSGHCHWHQALKQAFCNLGQHYNWRNAERESENGNYLKMYLSFCLILYTHVFISCRRYQNLRVMGKMLYILRKQLQEFWCLPLIKSYVSSSPKTETITTPNSNMKAALPQRLSLD